MSSLITARNAEVQLTSLEKGSTRTLQNIT